MEADDLLGIAQSASLKASTMDNPGTIICSIDKDLDQIPGWHYNFVDEKRYWIGEYDGLHNFYKQLICGDTTDNIVGIPGKGSALSSKVLFYYELPEREAELQKVILDLYEKAYPGAGLAAMIENGRLVKILTEPLEEDLSNLWRPIYVV